MATEKLAAYKAKRNFAITSEPAEGGAEGVDALSFVVQKHWATRLHYDFRIELDGVMLSWAVPKGPSYDPKDKRLAAHVEDHPISYSSFEGSIPAGQYGAGKVIVWDEGTWHPIGNPRASLKAGNLKFELRGHKLKGKWALIRMKGRGEKQEPWLLIKEKDEFVRPASEFSVVDEFPDSVKVISRKATTTSAAKSTSAKEPAATLSDVVHAIPKAPKTAKRAPRSTAKGKTTSTPSSAKPANLPETFSPQLATLVDAPPGEHSDWIFEIKFDGYRLLARIEKGDIKLFTRNGNDWTEKLKPLQTELQRMRLPPGWYDGEIVVLNDKGVPDFGALQTAFDSARVKPIAYFVFDAPYLAGLDLRDTPLEQRSDPRCRKTLAKSPSDIVKFSDAFEAPAESIVASACHLGLEGVIAKRRDSVYRSSRSSDWIKLKCSHRQEFVIGGWTDPKASRTGLGTLLLGVYEGGKLRYAGNVGSGFDTKTLASTRSKLDDAASTESPFDKRDAIPGRPHWVKPQLVAEVTFGEWTSAGHIRHSVFHALTAGQGSEDDRSRESDRPRRARPKPAAASTKTKSRRGASHGEPVSHALSTKLADHEPGASHRQVDWHHEGGAGSVLRLGRQADDGASSQLVRCRWFEHPAGVARPTLLPETRRSREDAWHRTTRCVA